MYERSHQPNQQLAVLMFAAEITKALLKLSHCAQHYRVEVGGSSVIIRESTQNPPIERRRLRFEALANILVAKDIFDFSDGYIRVRNDGVTVNIPCKEIKKINISKLFELLGVNISSKPDDVSEKVWTVIPREITSRWQRFSADMRQHVIVCCAPKAEDGFVDLLQTNVFTESKRSPITFEVPRIPVRLPNARLGQSPELYDLMDILKINQRVPGQPELRCNPVTREPFDLKDVIPDVEAYQNILRCGYGKVK